MDINYLLMVASAEIRIRNADFAVEMINFTKSNPRPCICHPMM